jgi:hypothetical protein
MNIDILATYLKRNASVTVFFWEPQPLPPITLHSGTIETKVKLQPKLRISYVKPNIFEFNHKLQKLSQ